MVYYDLPRGCSAQRYSPAIAPGIYKGDNDPKTMLALSFNSERIWEEKDGKVRYRKHPECEPPVDLNEFCWIKLQAHELPGN